MYRRATLAIVVSRTSMKVGTTTTAATSHGLMLGRADFEEGVMARPPKAASDQARHLANSSRELRQVRRAGRPHDQRALSKVPYEGPLATYDRRPALSVARARRRMALPTVQRRERLDQHRSP